MVLNKRRDVENGARTLRELAAGDAVLSGLCARVRLTSQAGGSQ